MDNNLIVSDLNSLKALFNEPLYLIKQEFTNESVVPEQIAPTKTFIYTGNIEQKIVFIVFSNDSTIPAIDKLLFSKTLSALKLNEAQIAICITQTEQCKNFEQASLEFDACKVVCFADAEAYGNDLLSTKQHNNARFYLCPSLSELQLDQELKVKWWNGLKAFIA